MPFSGVSECPSYDCVSTNNCLFTPAPGYCPSSAGLLPNGNFEQVPDASQLNGTRVTGLPSWEISGFVEYIQFGQNQQDGMVLAVPEGAHAVRLGNDASIRQLLTGLSRRAFYSVTFSAARTCAQAEQLNVSAGPESGILPIQTVYTSSGWDSYSYAFRARHTTAWLTVHNAGVEEDPACGPLVDAFAIKTLSPPHHDKGTYHVIPSRTEGDPEP